MEAKQPIMKGKKPNVEVGCQAPNFRLPWKPGQTVELSHWLGKPVVLIFYPGNWEPVSMDQLLAYQEALAEGTPFQAIFAAISVDHPWSHLAFARQLRLSFPLLSDFQPRGKAARAYGVFRNHDGIAERALFVIDPQGNVRWSYISPLCLNPGLDGILSALEGLKSA